MLKLRTILLYDYLYYILLLITLIVSITRLIIPKESVYTKNTTSCTGKVVAHTTASSSINITLKCKEKVLVYYYPNRKETLNIKLGDKLKVTGKFIQPKKNTTKYLFNYKKYLYNKNIFFLVTDASIQKISSTKNIYYKIKQFILNKASISPYIKAILFGDMSDVSKEATVSYQEIGISHLFAISGMHITILSTFILKILQRIKVKETSRYIVTSIFVVLYLSFIKISPSALRGVLSFILFSINKIYYFYIKPQNIFILVLIITLLINPFYIYDIGFQFSFIISLVLILTSKFLTGNYLLQLLKTSVVSFLISIPISMYNYFQINIMSILYNMFYVPFVSILIFPLSLLTLFVNKLLPIYNLLILILEKTSLFLSGLSFGKIIFKRLPLLVYIMYLIFATYVIYKLLKNDKRPLIIILIIFLIHTTYPSFTRSTYIKIIDVGQGDSFILHSNGETILIDTGGKLSFTKESSSTIVNNVTIPLLKSLGIKKIKALILTHGDADHMQEAKYLLKNFKVEDIYINLGRLNYLEQELLTYSPNIHIAEEGLTLTVGDITLMQLNEDMSDENDSSQIYYGKYKNKTFLFMGDASTKSERILLEKYELKNIDILKVGHHGSKTSSSKEFIDKVNPKYSIISVGKDNKFNHPNEEVLNNLYKSKIYRTDQYGGITFKFKKDKLDISTCPP